MLMKIKDFDALKMGDEVVVRGCADHDDKLLVDHTCILLRLDDDVVFDTLNLDDDAWVEGEPERAWLTDARWHDDFHICRSMVMGGDVFLYVEDPE
jgi:hypothetical protein